jgi:Mor family transcriptional regulator
LTAAVMEAEMKSDNRQMIEACFVRLQNELGPEAGPRAMRIFIEELGGFAVRVPSMRALEREARDARIRSEFNGANYDELALQHNLDVRRIRQIIDGS